jgi:hypothetical protein
MRRADQADAADIVAETFPVAWRRIDEVVADADPDRARRPRSGRGRLGGRGRIRVPVEVVVEPCFAGA